jgi:hypothetical protein
MVRHLYPALCLVVAACGSTKYVDRPVEVKVPVPYKVQPPQWILDSLPKGKPVWVLPTDSKAVACVTDSTRPDLVIYVESLRSRIDVWKAWAENDSK